jgi:DNA-binding transcriptional LysR family regulator
MLNVHHLELFYYVVEFQGITQASRLMPYGLSQPAISLQLNDLERQLGARLFQRRPFKLTPIGERVYAFIKPFFSGLKGLSEELLTRAPVLVRIAGPPVVLRDYLPPILRPLAGAFPNLSFSLKAGLQGHIEEWFESRQVDLAVTMLEGDLQRSFQHQPLLDLPLGLLVPVGSSLRSAEQLWKKPCIQERLISPPATDAISKAFESGLKRNAVIWDVRAEMSSIELVESYVAKGFGVGVTLMVPGCSYIPEVRALPLPGFPLVPIGLIWQGEPEPVVAALMKAITAEAGLMRQQQINHLSAA